MNGYMSLCRRRSKYFNYVPNLGAHGPQTCRTMKAAHRSKINAFASELRWENAAPTVLQLLIDRIVLAPSKSTWQYNCVPLRKQT